MSALVDGVPIKRGDIPDPTPFWPGGAGGSQESLDDAEEIRCLVRKHGTVGAPVIVKTLSDDQITVGEDDDGEYASVTWEAGDFDIEAGEYDLEMEFTWDGHGPMTYPNALDPRKQYFRVLIVGDLDS